MHSEYRAISRRFIGNPIFADSVFRGLPPEAHAALARIKQIRQFQKGILFIGAGCTAPGIYILRAGRARLFVNGDSNRLQIARPVKANEFLGLTETIAGLPYKISVASVGSCLCEFIEREEFLRFLCEESRICFDLARLLGVQLNQKYQLLCSLTF